MNDQQCTARLLASSLHDMRNILAVIRESVGLAQDVSSIDGEDAAKSGGNAGILVSALRSAQDAVENGVALVEAMDYMAQLASPQTGEHPSCDLNRASQGFCRMAARWAKGVRIRLVAGEAHEAVWAALPVVAIYNALLDILDLCASVGGQVDLRLTAAHWNRTEGIFVDLTGGENLALVFAAMTGKPSLGQSAPSRVAMLTPCPHNDDAEQRFFLSIQGDGADNTH